MQKNRCLLSKWLFKILHEEGVWQELLMNNYLLNKTSAQVQPKPLDSPLWKGIMAVKNEFLARGHFEVGNGRGTRFWEDVWLGNTTLAARFPSLFSIVRHKNVLVAQVLENNPLNIEFRRVLTGQRWVSWLQLVEELMRVTLTDVEDCFKWKLTPTGKFTDRKSTRLNSSHPV